MIGNFSKKTLDAFRVALACERLSFAQDDEEYADLREYAASIFADAELRSIEIPVTKESYDALENKIAAEIVAQLTEERGRLLGDTPALPIFALTRVSVETALIIAAGRPVPEDRVQFIELCLKDLGFDPKTMDTSGLKRLGFASLRTRTANA